MSQHTPGPWREPYLDTLPNNLKGWRIDSAMPKGVAVVAICYAGDPEITAIQEANARLIAAAPELLESLRECLDIVRIQNGNLHDDTNAIQAKALAAIAKATGAN